ncbi:MULTISPECIES: lycopene cyclase domain-containing protein [unclassified Cryobacterium]|uniref:lycopene cyclase domain-containing protein n=1 Tax=unclassified Cryobacterium TaxID=2649013 RepID=UPI00106B563A|nr:MULTISPECIES: lycopene cyclase domain-containing protein [unclassified Cryobacterium]TFB95317.1 lycopene cyclase domain-containing protein [Cryobacterium sp. MDB2-A-1]TFC11352.1 lycopene cyclase domain-containing protein [Cryobacterium sp. MDB2-A-2]TFC11649.1 lycopene cyclase domain-containing protein [Cryobacterium sp. MDB2-33-2]TFC18900.1 lycopene cyclase domain-containing protein [Cryobacterium sp. MDB2-10]
MTYLLLDLVFVVAAALAAVVAGLRRRPSRRRVAAIGCALLAVLVLSAIFDNVMIGVGLVAYDPAHTSGLRLGLAPVEDFAYPLATALLLPALWTLLPGRRAPGGRAAPVSPGSVDRSVDGTGTVGESSQGRDQGRDHGPAQDHDNSASSRSATRGGNR